MRGWGYKMKPKRQPWPVTLIILGRSFLVGLAYYSVVDIPGLTTTFVAIFTALLPYDLIIAQSRFSLRWKSWRELITTLLPRISGTTITLFLGLAFGVVFGVLTKMGMPFFLGAVLTVGLSYQTAQTTKGSISA